MLADSIPVLVVMLYRAPHFTQTVKWQVLQQERASQEEKEEVEDFGAAEHRKRELRKK